jgi:hypothetical protein
MNGSVALRFEELAKVAVFSTIVLVSWLGLNVRTMVSSIMSSAYDIKKSHPTCFTGSWSFCPKKSVEHNLAGKYDKLSIELLMANGYNSHGTERPCTSTIPC